MSAYIRLGNGRKFFFLDPKPSDFDINSGAKALSMLCRYAGQVDKFYSVAEHSCRVCDILPEEVKLEGLMHDFCEQLLGDITTPLKKMLPTYKTIEENTEEQMSRKFKLVFPFPPEIKVADMTLLVTEMRDLLPGNDFKNFPFEPLDGIIKPWSMKKAEREFLKRYEQYRRK